MVDLNRKSVISMYNTKFFKLLSIILKPFVWVTASRSKGYIIVLCAGK